MNFHVIKSVAKGSIAEELEIEPGDKLISIDGEIKIVKDAGKLVWKCPKCGNTDQSKLNVARRTCGYIGTQFWNQGRTQEIADRVLHL